MVGLKVTYPHMGNLTIGVKAMFERLGLEVVEPPPITKRTLTLGVQHSPEFACLPFKVNLGNFLEALERGADTIVVAGGKGPCRFGYYGQSQAEILKGLGYDFHYVTVESVDNGKDKFTAGVNALANGKSAWEVVAAIHYGYRKLAACDLAERLCHRVRPRERHRGDASAAYRESLEQIDRCRSAGEVKRASREIRRRFAAIPVDRERPVLKVGIIGEIYFLLEPYVNLHVEERLGYLGVETERTLYLSEWIKRHLLLAPLGVNPEHHYARDAAPYLTTEIGGHGRENVGKAVQYARAGFDGLVHICPLTCMPEIVGKSLYPQVTQDHGIPVLSLSLDEHAGEAGFETRLEAFVDLLGRRTVRERRS